MGLRTVLFGLSVASAAELSPIAKVQGLLEKMQAEVNEEAEKDAKIQAEMGCWCKKTKETKSAAIEAADTKIKELSAAIEGADAKAAQLAEEIEKLTQDMKDKNQALAEATEVRNQDREKWEKLNAESTEAINKLENALASIKKVHGEGEKPEAFLQVQEAVNYLKRSDFQKKLEGDLFEVLTAYPTQQLRGAPVALQQEQGPAFQSYGARSGQILGILKTLHEQMSEDRDEAKKVENAAQANFDKLKATIEKEVALAQEQKVQKIEERSKALETKANGEGELTATKQQLDTDSKILADAKEKCATSEEDFAARQKTRTQEQLALAEALKILTDDSSRDLFNKVSLVDVDFFQIRAVSSASAAVRERVSSILRRSKSPQLQLIAMQAKLDGFEKVKKAMDDMTAELKAEHAAEVEKKDYCDQSLMDNENNMQDKQYEKEDITALLEKTQADLEAAIGSLKEARATKKATEESLKAASLTKVEENEEFQKVIADQRAVKTILNKVLVRLQSFYAPGAVEQPAALVQQPKAYGNYNSHGSASGVMGLLQGIIGDTETEISESFSSEQRAQTEYATFVSESKESLDNLKKQITDLENRAATRETEIANTKESLATNTDDIEGLNTESNDLHTECDFLIKNYDLRQEARANELDAIAEAKAILSGADFE